MHEELAKIGRKSVQLLQQQQADGATGVVTMLGLEGEGTEEPRIVFEPAPLIEAPIDRATLASSPATGPPPRMMYSLFKSQAASSSASSSSAVMLRPEADVSGDAVMLGPEADARMAEDCESDAVRDAVAVHELQVVIHELQVVYTRTRAVCILCAAIVFACFYLEDEIPKIPPRV